MSATAEVGGKLVMYDGERWVPAWKVPWREVYCTTRWDWLTETVWCLFVVNALSATALGRRWLRERAIV
jgi:hypothetical protein